jgi:hypothetical protein
MASATSLLIAASCTAVRRVRIHHYEGGPLAVLDDLLLQTSETFIFSLQEEETLFHLL